MTTERTSFDHPGSGPASLGDAYGTTDTFVGTRVDDVTPGLSDAPRSDNSTGSMVPTMDSSGTDSGSGTSLGDAAGSIASRVADTAGSQLTTQVDSQMTRGADVLVQLSEAIRKSGAELRAEQPQIAGFADTAARQVDKAGQFLRQNDLRSVVNEVEGFARRQPAVFLGGALAVGLVASRFLKASPKDSPSEAAYRYDSNGRA